MLGDDGKLRERLFIDKTAQTVCRESGTRKDEPGSIPITGHRRVQYFLLHPLPMLPSATLCPQHPLPAPPSARATLCHPLPTLLWPQLPDHTLISDFGSRIARQHNFLETTQSVVPCYHSPRRTQHLSVVGIPLQPRLLEHQGRAGFQCPLCSWPSIPLFVLCSSSLLCLLTSLLLRHTGDDLVHRKLGRDL